MKNVVRMLIVVMSLPLIANAQEGVPKLVKVDSDSAVVRMNVAKYAQITGLDDFILNTANIDGSAGAIYSGFDLFNLESNCAVQVDLVGASLSKGSNILSTKYKLDDAEMTFQTTGAHNKSHKISAEAVLGNISSQEAGDYSADITLTVSAIQ